jgi:hypothetical protein
MPRQQPPRATAALVPEIARVFLVRETAMGRRITRAKAKIKAAKIPYRVPSGEDLPARVTGVLAATSWPPREPQRSACGCFADGLPLC